jgi:hypothetical protein
MWALKLIALKQNDEESPKTEVSPKALNQIDSQFHRKSFLSL